MRIVAIGVGVLIVFDLCMTLVFAQQPDPSKSAQSPWSVDPRCAVMSAHMGNQGAITPACIPTASGVPYLNQTPGYHQSQTVEQSSKIRSRTVEQPPNRE
jgi:hypothetical protein